MPSTHLSLHTHIIFSTKNRSPLIGSEWRGRLHAYLGGIVKGLGAVPLAVGGTADHVHLLVGTNSTHRLDYLLRDLKADSSKWIHDEIRRRAFAWQKGYGAFSVSPSKVDAVKRYVANQETHHKRYSFQEEYMKLLKSSGIQFDARYVW